MNDDCFDPIAELLATTRYIAIVGVSEKPHRASYQVAEYLLEQGYRVFPVNPKFTTLLGLPCYGSLAAVPEKPDIVDVFRSVEAMPGVVEEAIAVQAGAVWMQLGLVHAQAAQRAQAAGLQVVMDRCIKVEHRRLLALRRGCGETPQVD